MVRHSDGSTEIPSGVWSPILVEGVKIWVYHESGHTVSLQTAFDKPTNPAEVKHKNIFEK